MVTRFYGINYAQEPESSGSTGGATTSGNSGLVANGVASTTRDIEITFNIGTGVNGDARFDYIRQHKELVKAKVNELLDHIFTRGIWPPLNS